MPGQTFVALLRGVNIGRSSQRIAMADLRGLVSGLGYRNVRTLLNSGNVVFTGRPAPAACVAAGLESALKTSLGLSVTVVVLTAEDFAAIVDANPLAGLASNPSRLVLAATADAARLRALEALLLTDWQPEALAVGPRAAYFWCPGGFIRSPVAEAVRRVLGNTATMRNWATVLKLRDLASPV